MYAESLSNGFPNKGKPTRKPKGNQKIRMCMGMYTSVQVCACEG